MGDSYLENSLSLNGTNMNRCIREDAYWEEYQRVMIGFRVDKIAYLFTSGPPQSNGDRRRWAPSPVIE